MPNTSVLAADEGLPILSRRNVLQVATVLVLTSHSPAGQADESQPQMIKTTIDEFIATASAREKARYHADALAAAMCEINPSMKFTAIHDKLDELVLVLGSGRSRA